MGTRGKSATCRNSRGNFADDWPLLGDLGPEATDQLHRAGVIVCVAYRHLCPGRSASPIGLKRRRYRTGAGLMAWPR